VKPIPHVATPSAYLIGPGRLEYSNGGLEYRRATTTLVRFQLSAVRTVMCYGPVNVTHRAMAAMARRRVHLVWFARRTGSFIGRLDVLHGGGTLLRGTQHRVIDDPECCLELARPIVARKIASQKTALRHFQRHGAKDLGKLIRKLGAFIHRAQQTSSRENLRGIEGMATAAWYKAWRGLLRQPWEFRRRTRRPPKDPVNALLSLGYMLLLHRMLSIIQAQGMEPYLGCLHTYRAGRPSPACDLIEPHRVPAVDRWVLSICNQKRVSTDHFEQTNRNGVRLTSEAWPLVITSWEQNAEAIGLWASCEKEVRDFVERLKRHCPPIASKRTTGPVKTNGRPVRTR